MANPAIRHHVAHVAAARGGDGLPGRPRQRPCNIDDVVTRGRCTDTRYRTGLLSFRYSKAPKTSGETLLRNPSFLKSLASGGCEEKGQAL